MKHKPEVKGNEYVGPHYWCKNCEHFIDNPIQALEECKGKVVKKKKK